MRKLKLRFALPTAQLAVAMSLMYWGEHMKAPPHSDELSASSVTLICLGINAPAMLFRALGAWFGTQLIDRAPVAVFGFGLEECFFLLGVIACWYFVGRWLDHRKSPGTQAVSERFTVGRLALNLLVMALGAFLILLVIRGRQPLFHSGGAIIEKALFLSWSAFLIVAPSLKLARRLRKQGSGRTQ